MGKLRSWGIHDSATYRQVAFQLLGPDMVGECRYHGDVTWNPVFTPDSLAGRLLRI